MNKCKVIKKTVHVGVKKLRPVHIASRAIPCNLSNTKAINTCIFYRYRFGYLLIGISDNGEIIQVWCDNSTATLPIASKLIKTEAFNEKLRLMQPKVLYINDNSENVLDISIIANIKLCSKLLSNLVTEITQSLAEKYKTQSKKPTYQYVKTHLDSTISLLEYKQIYA